MKTMSKNQAVQKLMKMIGLEEFTKDIATSYVEVFLDLSGQNQVDEYDFDIMLDSAGEEGWLD